MFSKKLIKLSNPQKLLIVIFELAKGTTKPVPFTKIVIGAFKKYKKDFHLPGYQEYPDSEVVNKGLYRDWLKQNGYLLYGNKSFALTNKGIDYITKIKGLLRGKKVFGESKMDNYVVKEIKRITSLDSYIYYQKKQYTKILDTDFYYYIGVTVKTEKKEFIGRLRVMNDVIAAMKASKLKKYDSLISFHVFMLKKFNKEVNYSLND